MPEVFTIKYDIWNGRQNINKNKIQYRPSFQWKSRELKKKT